MFPQIQILAPQSFTPFRHTKTFPSNHSHLIKPKTTTLLLKTSNKTPQTTTTHNNNNNNDNDDGIPIEHVKTLVKFKSRYNYIRVLQVSRLADHPLSGSRLLLLDAPGNIHSISYLFKSLTNTYFDVFATLPPLLPPGPIAILGFGAGSAAKILLETYPDVVIHGWELDPAVISVAREYFGLEKLEKKYEDRLFVHIGDAMNAVVCNTFSGILVDLFSKGVVVSELQEVEKWERVRKGLRRGGRVMVNVGGSCVEPEDIRKDGRVVMEETLKAMVQVFGEDLYVLSLDNNGGKEDSSVALTGELPADLEEWKGKLIRPLRGYVDMWGRYNGDDCMWERCNVDE